MTKGSHALVAERAMREQIDNRDWEAAHGEADRILVRLLRMLGYDTLCDLYEQVGKWYA